MASIEFRTGKRGRTVFVRLSDGENPARPRIGFGRINKRQAEAAKVNIESLIRSKNTNGVLSVSVQEWLNSLSDSIRRRIEALELIEPVKRKETVTLKCWIEGYIKSRTDVKPRTITNLKQAWSDFSDFCNTSMSIEDFTGYDAEQFRRFLLEKGLAENTIRRRCKMIKQFFAAAIKKRIIRDNPFDGIPITSIANPDRLRFINRDTIEKVIESCPNNRWKLIFALARYAGLRIPSELKGLRWSDILWDKKRFIIHSPKTEHITGKATRVCPLFPEVENYLAEAFGRAEDGAEFVFESLDKSINLRTQAHRIIKRAGLVPWDKTFQNLRSSAETELSERFPIHVVTSWLGNSPDVAHKHYLQTHEEHFRQATENSGQNRGQKFAGDSCKGWKEEESGPEKTPFSEEETALCGGVQFSTKPIQHACRDSNPKPSVP